MTRRRIVGGRARVAAILVALFATGLVAVMGVAEVPTTVDSYGGNASAAGVHLIAGTNAFPNFSNGALGNRYPLAQAGQDISPASDATASVVDYGPLVATLLTTDCGAPPPIPSPLPNPVAPKPPDYCLAPLRDEAKYAHAQYPHPPGVGDATAPGVHDTATGFAKAHASELEADAHGEYTGAGGGSGSSTLQNSIADVKTMVRPDGAVVVTSHSHVGQVCIGACNVSNYLVVTDVDVTTQVIAINGKPVPTAKIAPGTVQFCGTPTTCKLVQVSDGGATVVGNSVPLPSTGTGAFTPVFEIKTLKPTKSIVGTSGSIDAVGLDVRVTQPGDIPVTGVPSLYTEYIIGEGHAEGFSLAATSSLTSNLTSDLGNSADAIGGIINNTVTNNYGSSTGTNAGRIVTKTKGGNQARINLAGAVKPPFVMWFFLWEASVMAAAITMVWARRRRMAEEAEG